MIYKNSDIPSTFNKIAEISDNYIVWVEQSILISSNSYEAYIQYFNPSFYYIYVDDYKIKQGDNYTYNVNYTNNGMYTYVDNYDVDYTLTCLTVDDEQIINDNDYYRADFNAIFLSGMILLSMFVIVCVRLLPKTRR